jgi:hypothetical protein
VLTVNSNIGFTRTGSIVLRFGSIGSAEFDDGAEHMNTLITMSVKIFMLDPPKEKKSPLVTMDSE